MRAEQALRLMVGKAWRLARMRRRRAAWVAEAVSVVWLAAVIAPATGGARWLTSPMMVLRQALAPCFQVFRNLCTSVPIAAERVRATRADQFCRMRKERAHATIRLAVRGSERVGVNRYRGLDGVLSECARGPGLTPYSHGPVSPLRPEPDR